MQYVDNYPVAGLICADCAHYFTNSGVDGIPEEDLENYLHTVHEFETELGAVVVTTGETEDFSRIPCDACRTDLGGYRYHAQFV